jgi:pyridoxal phosphate enzyme (YggS family)
MSIASVITEIQKEIGPFNAQLIAVTKTQPVELIKEAYDAGLRSFGENRVQELTAKVPELPTDINWHLIGHLQTNKVKQAVPHAAIIESVDSLKVLAEINKQAQALSKVQHVLLQVHIATEETKFGLSADEVLQLLSDPELSQMQHVQIAGLMGIATNTDNENTIRNEFKALRQLFDKVKSSHFQTQAAFKELSMGMSSDYRIALDEGSTMVRIGSSIFGARK